MAYNSTLNSMSEFYKTISEYENDDMWASIAEYSEGYSVYAGSYDGQMNVTAEFQTLEVANVLYKHIIEYYSDTPPIKRKLNRFIKSLARADMQTAALAF